MPESAANYKPKTNEKKSNQWKKLNFVLIQRDTIFVILICLQAKLQLFQKYRALLLCASNWEFFWQLFTLKKACFCLLQFYDTAKAGKKPSLKQTEQQELNSVTNMTAEIDIDAFKIFKKSWTNEAENRQTNKTSQSQRKIYRF